MGIEDRRIDINAQGQRTKEAIPTGVRWEGGAQNGVDYWGMGGEQLEAGKAFNLWNTCPEIEKSRNQKSLFWGMIEERKEPEACFLARPELYFSKEPMPSRSGDEEHLVRLITEKISPGNSEFCGKNKQNIEESIEYVRELMRNPNMNGICNFLRKEYAGSTLPPAQEFAEMYPEAGKMFIQEMHKIVDLPPKPAQKPIARKPLKKTIEGPPSKEKTESISSDQETHLKIHKRHELRPRTARQKRIKEDFEDLSESEGNPKLLRKRDSTRVPNILNVYKEEQEVKWLLKLDDFLIAKFNEGLSDPMNLNFGTFLS
jgi:hypothetical protein